MLTWRMRLTSAFRTALACAIVGGATLYGPEFFVKDIKFVAFSYLTVVLIVPDATLGLALRGCWHAFCATLQVVPIAVLVRWTFPTADGVPVGAVVLAAAAASFLVALPEFTHLTSKRIAFGQIVLVCTDAVLIRRPTRDGVMHPVYVAASTGLGGLASVLALLLPYPDIACHKMKKLCKLYAESAYQRINLYSIARENRTMKTELLSQAKPLSEDGARIFQSITTLQEGMKWDRIWCRHTKQNQVSEIQAMELQMRGMEYSLASSSSSSPEQPTDQDRISNFLLTVSSKLNQLTHHPLSKPPAPEQENQKPPPPHPTTCPPWLHLYSSCADALIHDSIHNTIDSQSEKTETTTILTAVRGRLEFALKCCVSLSLAILFGLILDKENGCWAGLTVAISLVEGRQAVFKVANARAQGTAIGSVYGVISCYLFHREEFRLVLALLPWVVFASGFLRRSRMYGDAGGVTAAIGALLILGRKDYGDPSGFAIARLVEVCIGLSVFVAVEILTQPVRAATLVKSHLSRTLCSMEECLKELSKSDNKRMGKKIIELRGMQRKFGFLVCELGMLVGEGELEPDFWYLPFRGSCYRKVVVSLNNMADMMYFIIHYFNIVSESSDTSSSEWLKDELGRCKETLRYSHLHLETANFTDARAGHQENDQDKFKDLEVGDLQDTYKQTNSSSVYEEEDNLSQGDIQRMGAIGFCFTSLRKEMNDINTCIIEINQSEKTVYG